MRRFVPRGHVGPYCGAAVAAAPIYLGTMRGMAFTTTTALRLRRSVMACEKRSTLERSTGDDGSASASLPAETNSLQAVAEHDRRDGEGDWSDDAPDENFDELEAASQEMHDLCYAMIAHLRKADPEGTTALFESRTARRFREPVPEHKRRLLHGRGDRTTFRRNRYRTEEELRRATDLFMQLGDKLLVLLEKPVLDRLIESAGRGHATFRRDGLNRLKNPLERASWRGFPIRWFKHAPFEVQQLRADIPEATVKNTRTLRDISTLRSLFTLMEPQHPFRERLERRMFDIVQHYDPAVNPDNRRLPIGRGDGTSREEKSAAQ